ncbi:MAG: DUF4476 domain-containing protein [Bacteroidales bacterium]|nr:DUF4476 domain-containing protein [Bacteroidales bacterium]
MMKKLFFFLTLMTIVLNLSAQQPLATFFSENGEKFWVIMDGKQINEEPMSRVENVKLENEWAFVKIKFDDQSLPEIEKRITGLDADGNASAITWALAQNNKGKWQIKPSSWKKLDEVKTESTKSIVSPISEQPVSKQPEPTTTTTTTTTKTISEPTSTTTAVNGTGNSFSMDININDQTDNTNVNMNISLPGMTTTQTQTEQTYTTVNTSTTTVTEQHEETNETVEVYDPMPGYNGSTGCENPMSGDRFSTAKNSIESKDFEDTKLTVARQILKANCLLVSQVKDIMMMFDYESTRLEFAKEAYDKTYDIDNYYLLNDAFDFESSIDELNDYINQ